ncbi:hypothetical protein ABIA95_001724 [Bradyrhizobium sp. LA8.1]
MDHAHARVAPPLAGRAADVADRRRLRADGRDGHRHRAHRRSFPAKCNRERPRQPGKLRAHARPAFRPRIHRLCGAPEERHRRARKSRHRIRRSLPQRDGHAGHARGAARKGQRLVRRRRRQRVRFQRRADQLVAALAGRRYFGRRPRLLQSPQERSGLAGRDRGRARPARQRSCDRVRAACLRSPRRIPRHGVAGHFAGAARILLRLGRARRGILDRDAPPEWPAARARSACRRDDRTEFSQRHARADGGSSAPSSRRSSPARSTARTASSPRAS